MATDHPYLPANITIPGYVENDLELSYILFVFFGVVAAILVPTYVAGNFALASSTAHVA